MGHAPVTLSNLKVQTGGRPGDPVPVVLAGESLAVFTRRRRRRSATDALQVRLEGGDVVVERRDERGHVRDEFAHVDRGGASVL